MPKTGTTSLIGSADAATELCIDRSTLTRWVKRNKITPALVGSGTTGEMFFHAKDIAALKSSPSSVPPEPDGGALRRSGKELA